MDADIMDSTSTRTVTGFFDTKEAADRAESGLIGAGFPSDAIRISGGQMTDGGTEMTEGKGFWASLKDFFIPEEDRHGYDEGLRRGGYLLTLSLLEANRDRAMEILDREGTVDMKEREATWRAEGWNSSPIAPPAGSVDHAVVSSMPGAPMVDIDVDRSRQQSEAADLAPAHLRDHNAIGTEHSMRPNPVTDSNDVIPLLTEDVQSDERAAHRDAGKLH